MRMPPPSRSSSKTGKASAVPTTASHSSSGVPHRAQVQGQWLWLIVDEIGYLPVISGGGNLFFQLVNARYERGAMILTSNRGFAEWGEVFSDPVVATARLDRLLHHAVVVQIEGASYRVRQHADLIPENLRIRTPTAAPPLPARRRGRPPKDRTADHTVG